MAEDVCMRVHGGLGNQMFQLAAGLATARRLGTGLLVHPVDSARLAHARFALEAFGRPLRVWRPDPAAAPLRARLMPRSGKRAERLWRGPVFEPPGFCDATGFGDVAPGTYLKGYFQSESFFASVADEVRDFFALERFLAEADPDLVAAARAPDTASVHVRRGDYASDPATRAVHGLLEADHYARARALAERLAPVRRWLVFTDDAKAAAAITEGWPGRTIVAGPSALADMALMAACAHHVIANSSFSWWGAFLGRNPERVVIAPRKWFSDAEMRRVGYVDGVCPVGWILV